MKTVGIFEAKTHLSELVAEAERGETITITRNGVPAAQLRPVPPDENREERARRMVREAEDIRQRVVAKSGGVSREEILQWIHEDRP
jgi:prevent-host-death family protein